MICEAFKIFLQIDVRASSLQSDGCPLRCVANAASVKTCWQWVDIGGLSWRHFWWLVIVLISLWLSFVGSKCESSRLIANNMTLEDWIQRRDDGAARSRKVCFPLGHRIPGAVLFREYKMSLNATISSNIADNRNKELSAGGWMVGLVVGGIVDLIMPRHA